ncbi:unnamed protein product [Phytophthora fragariaefolia]|uniref:Unnamed protein product n=1 Tax=Phytophthora fragariaefolia TaxID=1490495 RepID=A0A9W6UFF6_9STRA|nr:unnamed protein product [Phytophthora fragariaefolia]
MIGSEKQPFSAPECVAQYNTNMQGVDRLDQIRGRFSTADGHSYKRWHKTLALALIDVARSNAYLTRRLAKGEPAAYDPHRMFLMELVGELLNGQWNNAPRDGRMLFGGGMLDDEEADRVGTPSSLQHASGPAELSTTACTSVSSRQIHAEKSRKRRRCILCRWEGRNPTEVTNYCLTHDVCLCRIVHNRPAEPWMCSLTPSTCWDKFHQFYYPSGLFTDTDNVRRCSKLAKLKATHKLTSQAVRRPAAARQIAYRPQATSAMDATH